MEKEVNIQEIGNGIVVTGVVNLQTANDIISKQYYQLVDISQAEFIIDKEEWQRCLGMSHHGPVYARGGTRDVEVLIRFLEKVRARKVILPANIERRHMNAAMRNNCICKIEVPDDCRLFAMKDGDVYNKKLTKLVFEACYTVADEKRYKQRIKEIVAGLKPAFETLGMFAFHGDGDPAEVARCFVEAFGGYREAVDLTVEIFGEKEAPDMMDLMQMEAIYTVANGQGFLPPLMLEQVGVFTMKMNSFFIEAQQRIK